MGKLPRISGKEVIRAPSRAGFKIFEQKGGHVFVNKFDGEKFSPRVTIPFHGSKTITPKTLKSILIAAGLTADEFKKIL